MANTLKTNQQIATEVIQGKWGNGEIRKQSLTQAGYDFAKIQSIVNAIMRGDSEPETGDNPFKITGTKTMEVTIDLSVYNGINIIFTNGGEV